MRKFLSAFFVLFSLLWISSSALASPTTVSTMSGKIVGVEDDGIRVFKGIPYAKPPVGELRFAPPQRMESWSEPLEATQYGPTAVQVRELEGLPM